MKNPFKRHKPTKITVLDNFSTKMPENEAEFKSVLAEMNNALREQDKRFNDIDRGVDEITGTDYRPITISNWLTAMRSADQPWEGGYRSNWVSLFDIFFNMLQDTHVQGVVETLKEGVKSKDFYISDENGNKLDDITEQFKAKWFYDYMDAIVNVRLWGFGLIQLQDYDGEKITVREVNRKHVRPDLGGVVKQQYDNTVYKDWNKEPYKTWTIYLYENNLGKLNAGVRWYIYKTEVARFWAKFNQLYGVPPIVAKTKITDIPRKTNMIEMLKKWVSSRWMVMDQDDEVEQFAGNLSGSGQQFFENLIRLADEQISKSLLGSTMVLDNGSSKSQSETHETNTTNFIKSLCRTVKFSVDKDLIPRLRKIGFEIPEKARFVWDNSEKLTMKERAEVINLMNLNYKVDESTASEFVGIELEEKEVEEIPFKPSKEELENLYKTRMNGKD